MNLVDSFYREEILEHYRSPLNFGRLADADSYSRQANPLCGDEIAIFIKWDKRDKGFIRNIRFIGKGCAICIASASILTDYAKGKRVSQLTKFGEQDMLGLLNIEISETRKKCALLALYVLNDCL